MDLQEKRANIAIGLNVLQSSGFAHFLLASHTGAWRSREDKNVTIIEPGDDRTADDESDGKAVHHLE